jgi:hypothetical protein
MQRPLAALAITCALVTVARADTDPRATEPRLLGFGDGGITEGTTSVFAGKVDGAIYDPSQDLIWFLTGGNLEVLDLRDAAAKPVVIAKKFPTNLGFAIAGASSGESDTKYAGVYPIVHVDSRPRITTGQGAEQENWDNIDPDAKKKIKRIKLVGKAWLKKQATRAASSSAAAAPAAPLPNAKLPAGTCTDDADGPDCGSATPIGTTPYQLVEVEASCGDACFVECLAYDPKTGLLANPAADSKWTKPPASDLPHVFCDGVLYADGARGVYYVTGTSDDASVGDPLCTIDGKGVTCRAAAGWHYFGWLRAEK